MHHLVNRYYTNIQKQKYEKVGKLVLPFVFFLRAFQHQLENAVTFSLFLWIENWQQEETIPADPEMCANVLFVGSCYLLFFMGQRPQSVCQPLFLKGKNICWHCG